MTGGARFIVELVSTAIYHRTKATPGCLFRAYALIDVWGTTSRTWTFSDCSESYQALSNV